MKLNFDFIYNSLLNEALLSQSEFIEKLSDKYGDLSVIEKEKLLTKLLTLAKSTELLDLKGKENKRARKNAENQIDDELKKYNFKIKGIRKLYDSLLKFIEKKSEVSVDDCFKKAHYFMEYCYPGLRKEDKILIDRGDYDFENVYRIVRQLTADKVQSFDSSSEIDIVDIYEDDDVKIVFPMTNDSFNNYIGKNTAAPVTWCTQNLSTWTDYNSRFFVAIAYSKDSYKLELANALISLKIDFNGNVRDNDTCDFFNNHMNETLLYNAGIGEKARFYISEFVNNFIKKRKEQLKSHIKKLEANFDRNNKEEFCASIISITAMLNPDVTHDVLQFDFDTEQLQETLFQDLFIKNKYKEKDEDFLAKSIIDLTSFFENKFDSDQKHTLAELICSHTKEILNKAEKNSFEQKVFDYAIEMSTNRRSHKQYPLMFLNYIDENENIDKSIIFKSFESSFNTNNIELFNKSLEIIQYSRYRFNFLLKCNRKFKGYMSEEQKELDENFVKSLFLSQSFANITKLKNVSIFENLPSMPIGYNIQSIVVNYKDILKDNFSKVAKNANDISNNNTDDITISQDMLETANLLLLADHVIKNYKEENKFSDYIESFKTFIFFSKENFNAKLLFENEKIIELLSTKQNIVNYFAVFLDYLDESNITNTHTEFPIITRGFEKQVVQYINEFFHNKYFSSYKIKYKLFLDLFIKFCNTTGGQISVDNISRYIDEKIDNVKDLKTIEILFKNINAYNEKEDNLIIEYLFTKIYDNRNKLFSLFFNIENNVKIYFKGEKPEFGKMQSSLKSKILSIMNSNLKDAALEYFNKVANNITIDSEQKLFFVAYMFFTLEKLHDNNYFDLVVKNNLESITNLYLNIITNEEGILNTSYIIEKNFIFEFLSYLNKKVGPRIKSSHKSELISDNFYNILISFLTTSEYSKFKIFHPSFISELQKSPLDITSIISSLLYNILSTKVINKSEIVKMILRNDSFKIIFENIGYSKDLNKHKKKIRKLMFENLFLKSSDGRDLILTKGDYQEIEKLLKNTSFRDYFRKKMTNDFKQKFAQTLFNSNIFVAPLFIVKLGLKEFYSKLIRDAHIRRLIKNIIRG